MSATFDDVYFTPADRMPEACVGTADENELWVSPMPVPQQALPPAFPQMSLEKSDLRGDVETSQDWPDLRITGTVTDLGGNPIPGLKLDFLQTDVQGAFGATDTDILRGHQFTNDDGSFELWSIVPGQFATLRTRLLHLFIGGENEGFESPFYRTETFFPDPFDKDLNADGIPDKAFIGGELSNEDVVGIENDRFVPVALEGAGAEFTDLASNILTIVNDPLVDGYFDTTLNIVMPGAFQAPSPLRLPGDVDGDGEVAFEDFLILSENFGTDVERYTLGDLNGDGTVQFPDFLILSGNFGQTRTAQAASVPEPHTLPMSLSGIALLLGLARSIRTKNRRFT